MSSSLSQLVCNGSDTVLTFFSGSVGSLLNFGMGVWSGLCGIDLFAESILLYVYSQDRKSMCQNSFLVSSKTFFFVGLYND